MPLKRAGTRILICCFAALGLIGFGAAQSLTTTVSTGNSPAGIAVNPVTNKVYIANSGGNTVTVYFSATGATNTVTVGSGPQGVAVNPLTNRIYVTSSAGVTIIDGTSDSIITTAAAGANPTAVAVNLVTNQIYVVNAGDTTATVINGATSQSTTIPSVGAGPNAVAINPVTNRVYMTTSAGLTVIDGGSNTVVATVSAGTSPAAVAVNPASNSVYVANNGSGDVDVFDGSSNSLVTDISVGGGPDAVMANPATNKIFVANQGGYLSVIDGATNLATNIGAGIQPAAIALNILTNQIYVANAGSASVTDADGTSGVTTTIAVVSSPLAIAVNPVTNKVYVASSATTGGLSVIDGAVNAPSTIATGNSPVAVAANPDTSKVYVANNADNTVTVINELTQSITTVGVGTAPQAVTINPVTNQIFVANAGSNDVSIISGSTDGIQATVAAGMNTFAVAVNPLTNQVYAANSGDGSVTVIDGSSGTLVASVSAGTNPNAVAVNPATDEIYVVNEGDNTVTVINGTSDAVAATVDVGSNPDAVDVNSLTNQVFVANRGDGTVTVIDGGSNTVETTVTVGTNPQSVAVDSVTNKVYVANSGGGVTVIDPLNGFGTATVNSGEDFAAVVVNPEANKIYAVDPGGLVVAIDGWTNSASSVSVGTSPSAAAVDAVTGNVYIANTGGANLTVITPNALPGIPLTASVQGVGDAQTVGSDAIFSTSNANPSFTATVSSSFLPNPPPPTTLYYQLDAISGPWAEAIATSGAGSSSAAYQFGLSGLTLGTHTVYVYAAYGNEGGSASVGGGSGNSPEIGDVTAYPFSILPVTTTTTVSADVNPQNAGSMVNFMAQVTPNFGTSVPSGLVGFFDGASLLGQATLDGTGQATFQTGALSAGAHSITARYLGSASLEGSTSSALPEVISGPPASITAASGSGQTAPVNTAFSAALVVFVQDSNLNPVPNAAVSFSGSGLGFANGGAAATDGTGHASMTASPTASGGLTATASVAGVTTPATFNLTGVIPPVLSLSFAPSEIALNATSTLTFDITNPTANTVALNGVGFTNNLPTGLAVASPNGVGGNCSGAATAVAGSQTISLNGATLTANSGCTLTVSVTGEVSSGYTDISGAVTSANGGTGNVASADLLVASGVVASTSALDFGSQVVGTTSASQAVTFTNTTADTVTVDSVAATSSFGETNTCTAIAPSDSCSVSITFAPSATGTLNGSLIMSDSMGTQIVLLSGIGIAPGVSLTPSSWNFGSVVVGTLSTEQTVTITNTGTSALIISALGASGDFGESDNCVSSSPLAPQSSCAAQVSFQPMATGSETGVLTVTDNGGTQTAFLSGTGVGPGVGLSTSTLTFGSQVIATASAAQSVTLTNNGDSNLTVNSFMAEGDFAVSSSDCAPPLTLAQGLSCTLQVVFTPQSVGTRTGAVTISDSLGTHVVALVGTGVAPGVGLSSSTLSFSDQLVSTTSVAQNVTLTNTGTSDLTVNGVAASGDFAATGNCVTTGTIIPNATCTVSVTFSPSATGARTGTVTLADSAGTQIIALSGSGVAPGIGFAPSSVSFGSQVVGTMSAALNVIVTNTGTSNLAISAITPAGDFAESDTCVSGGTLAPNATCTISITFSPVVTGTRSGSVTVVDSLGSQVLALSGTGNAPGASLSPASLTFGSQTVNTTSSSQSSTLTNNGSSSLTITGITVSGDFAETDTCTSANPIEANATCAVTVTFAPTAAGTRTGTVVIHDEAGTQIVSLTGTGAAPGVSLSPATLSFGSVTVGDSSQSTASISLSSGTSSSLTVTGVSISGDYAFANQCTNPVSPGGSCSLSVTFSPVTTGPRTGSALISYSVGTGSGQLLLALAGTGTAPGVGLSPSLLTFGSETVGVTTAAQAVTLSNTGTSSLAITSIAASGDYSQTNNCPATVAEAGQCTIQVTFTPAVTGVRNGAITIGDSAGTQVVALSGTGIAAGISLSSSTVSFGNQVVTTTSAAQTVTLSNTGSAAVTVTSVAAAGDFAESNTCSTVASGGNCTISITFTPSANGTRTGTVTIVDSAGTQVIATNGTGTQPGGNLSASSLTYGSQTVGTTSAAQTVTLTNSGSSALTVSSSSTSGDFAVSSSNCGTLPATVAAGSNCQFQVTFIPSTTGTRTGSLILGDSVGTQVVSLSGTGSAPGVSLSPSTLSFGTVTVGTSSQQTANISLDIATGSSMTVSAMSVTGDYTIGNHCTSAVAAGGSCSVSVTFNPAAVGTRTGTVLINYTVASTSAQLVLALTGTGTAPGVSLTPSSLTFGSQLVGSNSTVQSSTLTNSGTSGLTGITITPIGDFSDTNNCGNTAAGATCTIVVTFTPAASGLRTGYMVITDNAGTQTLSLTGTGTAPGVSVSPTNVNFGSQVVSTTTAATAVTLTDTGTSSLSVSSVTASGDFAVASNPCGNVSSGAHCTFQITFTPTATGTRTGTVTIIDGVGTQVVALSGTGNAPGVGLSAGLVDFGTYTVGTVSAAKTITLTNTGTSTLTVNSFSASGDYAVSSANCSTLPTTLSAGGTCTLAAVFAPAATGTRPGTVTIVDSIGSQVVTLTGVGLVPGVSLSPASLSFGSVNVGASAQSTANINLDGSATGALTVTSTTVSGDYQLVNNCSSVVAPGGACSLSVTFTPTAIGDRSGTVVIGYSLGTDAGELVLPLDGAGLAPEATLSPSSISFGSQLVGTTTAAQTVTVTNNGTATLNIVSVAASGDFTLTNNCGSLGTGLSCTIQLTFAPTASGTRTGTLTVTDVLGTQAVALSGTGTDPGVQLSQTNLFFGNQPVGTVSGGQTVTVTNAGNSTLTFTSILAAGDYAETDNCSSPISPAGTCSITVTFDPSEVGARNGTISLIGNAETQVIVLAGTGTSNATGTVSSRELTFGPQQVGTTSASQQLIFTNVSGTAMTVNACTTSGDFVITSGCLGPVVLLNLDTLTIGVAFQPSAPGDRVGVLQISDSDGTQQVALQGTGLQSGINISPLNLNFGNQTTNTSSSPQTVTLTNTGSADLSITSLSTTAEFTASSSSCGNLPATVSVGASCTFAVTFNPSEAGTESGTLTLVDGEGTQSVGLNGTGVPAGIQFSQSPLTFGSQTVGTSSAAQITTLTNNGLSPLVVSSVVATGDYSVNSTECTITSTFTLAVGASCDLDVKFSPVTAGVRVGALTVEDNDGVQAIAMSGNATLPGVSLSSSNLSFGQVIVGANAQMTTNLNVSSTTTGSLQVTSITITGNYAESDNCTGTGVMVAPGGSCFVSVTFSPKATGTLTGMALIEYTLGGGTGELVLQMSGTGTTPGIALTPPSLSFGSQVINTSSSAQSLQLSNTGTSGLTVSSISAAGNFSETNNCASIPVGSSCSINVIFTPAAAQTLTGTITITHDAGTLYAGVAVVPLSGIGTAPGVSLSPASVNFGNQTINTTSGGSSVTLTNSGTSALHVTSVTAAGDFSQSNTCSTVSSTGTCSITITFTPRASGSRTGTITVADDAGTQVIALSGTGTAPGVSLSPPSINFGSQTVDTTSSAELVTVTNSGGSTLTISSYSATGDFGVSSTNCTTVSSGGQCTLQVTFSPALIGIRSGTVELTDNAGVQIIILSGQGTAPGISLSPSTLNFGSVAVGSSSQLSVTILLDAASDAPMTVNSVTVDGDFGVTNNCTSQVSPGGQCSMLMTFTPATTGARTGVATITYTLGSATDQLEVSLSGTGLAPVVSFTPPSVAFGSQIAGTTSATQVVTLRNTGTSGLTGPSGSGGPVISINGDFSQSNNCSGGLATGGSCTITVSFTPATTGTRNGIINVNDNLGLQTVALSGSGIAPGASPSPSTLSFGTQVVGTTGGSQSVTVTNTGTSSLSFTSIAASGDFGETNTCTGTISQNGTCNISVTFSPTTTGTRNGTVTLVDNAGTQVVTLSGTGNAPGVSLTATTLAFGSQIVNTTSASQSVTLTNNGTSSLAISSVTADSDFAETDNCTNHSPLAANGTCTITVTFTPVATGGQIGAVSIVDGAGTQVITLNGTGIAPGVNLSSSSLNFGSVVVNTASATQSVTLTNTGTSSLSISNVTANGDFSQTNTCLAASPLPPSGTNGNSCAITITFTPVATGSRSGAITITDGVGSQFVALTGTGNAPGVQLSASSVTFGSQTLNTTSAAQMVTLTNSGTSSLAVSSFTTGGDFAVASTDCPNLPTSLAAGGVCTLQITFTPDATGTRTGTVTISDSLGTHVVALTGTGAAPGASLSPSTLTFGSVTVGATSPSTVSVNLSSATSGSLTVNSTSIDGDYSLVNHCSAAVSPGSSCSLTVTFAPSITGTRTGTALVNYTVGGGGGTLVLAISGTGIAPGVGLSPSSLSFGSQVVGTSSSSSSVTVTNNGTSGLMFTGITSSGDFSQTNTCATVTSGNTCSVQVTFLPTASGARTGTVSLVDNAGTQILALSGTGTAPGVTLSPATYNFGSVVVNANSATKTIALTNSGTSVLTITSITASAEFSDTTTCGASVAANGGSCNITATFTPAATGTRNGTITIVDGAGTHVVTLSGTGTAPGVSLTASSLTFGNQVVSTTSSGQTVTLTNNGTSNLSITSVAASGDFARSTTCSGTIAQNATCTITVTFSPTASGGRTGAVTIVDSVGTQVISLNGTGTAPGVSLSASTLNFGNQVVSTTNLAQTVTLTNTGTSSLTISSLAASGDFSESDNCISSSPLAAGTGSCTITARFTPTATGTRSGAITISDGPGTQSIALAGIGQAPAAQLSSATLTFGSQVVSTTSASQSVTLTNNGTSGLSISTITASGDFAQTNTCISGSPIAANGTCSVTVTFTPTAVGARTGAVAIVDSAGTQAINLSGTGSAPGVSLNPTALNFGSQVVNTSSASQPVEVNNNGTSTLNVASVSAVGDFSQTNNCAGVATGSACTVQVIFTPTATGTRNGTVSIADNAGTQVIALSGTGNAPGVSLTPASVNFGSVTVGSSSAQNVALTNTGTSNLTITSIAAAGDFAQASSNCTTIAASGGCTIQVTFAPTAAGTRNGAVTVTDNAGAQVIALSGAGTAPGVSLSASVVAFADQVVATTSVGQSVTLTNSGTSSLAISSITASGDFAQTNTCLNGTPINANGTCTITSTFTPMATGGRTGAVTIVDSVGAQVIALSGNGLAPELSLAPASINFGNQTVATASAPQIVTLTNDGTSSLSVTGVTASGDFGQTSYCGLVAAGASCTLQVTFSPSATGALTGTLTVNTTAGVGTVSLSGNGTATGAIVSEPAVIFGSQALATTSLSQSITVTDTGTSSLTVTSVAASGDFAETNNCSTLATQSFCTVQVTFTPSGTGVRNGILSIADSVASHAVVLSGVGFDPAEGLSASNLTFGSQTIGTISPPQIATLTNTGSSALNVSGIAVTDNFGVTSADCPSLTAMLAPGATCTLAVTFSPSATGVSNGELTISDINGTQLIVLNGTGIAPGVSLSPANLNFGSVTLGTSTELPVNVSVDTSTTGSLTPTSIIVSGAFSLAQNLCTAAVSPGGGCALSIAFNPAAAGTRTGTALINYTVGGNRAQLVLALSGVGTAPGVALSSSSLNFGSVTVGTISQSTVNLNVDSSTNASMTVSHVAISGDFTISTDQCTAIAVNPGSGCSLAIRFAPATTGLRTGVAVIDYTVGSGSGELLLALSGNGSAPGVSLSPSTLDFGSVTVGTAQERAATVVVDPSALAPVTVTNIAVSGDFTVTQNLCSAPISPGNGCGLSILFSPSSAGTLTGTAVVSYNVGSASSQLLLALSGNGVAPGVALSPAALDFGSVVVGTTSQQTANVTVDFSTDGFTTVTGVSSSGDFTVASQCSDAIAPGGECGLSVTFAPAAVGLRTGTAVVNYADGRNVGQLLLALAGTGIAPAVTLSPPSVNFGTEIINTASGVQSLQVLNTGTSDLNLTSVTADGDFAETDTCSSGNGSVTISAGNGCSLLVTFTPSAIGTRNGTITIVDNAGTQTVALTGTGNAPGVGLDSSTLTFGTQGIGTTSGAQTVTVTNTGTSDLTVSSITAAGDFAQTNNWPTTVAPGANFQLSITFTPAAAGVRNGTVTILDNEGTHVIALTGTGVDPVVQLNPTSLIFASQLVGTTSASQLVTVSNVGTSPLMISSVVATGNFSETNNCATVTAGNTCTIQVTFTPALVGLQNGTVVLTANVPIPAIALSGTGVQPSLQVSPASLTFPVTTVTRSSATQTVSISNTGTSLLTVTSISASAEFNVTNNCPGSLPPGSSCNVSVSFAPSASGVRSGTLTVTSNGGASPQIVPLTGIGADYTLTIASGSNLIATIAAGQSTKFQADVSPLNYSKQVKLICLGAPPEGVCTIQPQSVQLSGSGASPVTITVTTTAATFQTAGAQSSPRPFSASLWFVLAVGIFLLPRRNPTRRRVAKLRALFLLGFGLLLIGSCGGGANKSPSSTPGTPSGTYNLMLVGTGSDGLQRNLQLTLIVN